MGCTDDPRASSGPCPRPHDRGPGRPPTPTRLPASPKRTRERRPGTSNRLAPERKPPRTVWPGRNEMGARALSQDSTETRPAAGEKSAGKAREMSRITESQITREEVAASPAASSVGSLPRRRRLLIPHASVGPSLQHLTGPNRGTEENDATRPPENGRVQLQGKPAAANGW